MKAVVTGGCGFIGSHVVDLLLAERFDVTVIDNLITGQRSNLEHHADNKHLTIEQLDINDITNQLEGTDYVFHFAGLADILSSIEQPTQYMATNVLGTTVVLEAARKANIKKMVYAASSSCYGNSPAMPTTEQEPISLTQPYALSKYLGEQTALNWAAVYGLPVCAVRIFSAYGPRGPLRTLTGAGVHTPFSVFLAQKMHELPFTVVGDGSQSRDFVYVTDVARAFYAVAEYGIVGESYNCGLGQPSTINELVDILGGEVVYIPKRPGQPECTWANIDKIREATGWKPTVSFADGVQRTVATCAHWQDSPTWEPEALVSATHAWFEALSHTSVIQ